MEEVKQSLQETASKEREVINRCSLKNGRFATVKACT